MAGADWNPEGRHRPLPSEEEEGGAARASAAWLWAVALAGLIALLAWALGPAPHVTAAHASDPRLEPRPLGAAPAAASPAADQTPRQLLGIERLERELGARAPTGRGIPVGHVEGDAGDYAPNLRGAEFDHVRFTARSGTSKVNGHTESTARHIYGPAGLAPGITDVYVYSATHWLSTGYLRPNSTQPAVEDQRRLFNHSWIAGGAPGTPNADAILRRVDQTIDQRNVVMVVGVNNGASTPVPALLASAYNVIAVGQAQGASSGGYTTIEGAGRCKPEVVAPGTLTSFSTPMVTAVVARLMETADGLEAAGQSGAARAETLKAVLLAGAQKPAGWRPEPGKPLDAHLGAGLARCDTSHAILTAGKAAPAPGATAARYGWDYRALPREERCGYEFALAENAGEVSIMLTWHRRIDGAEVRDVLTGEARPRLADFDLKLFRLDQRGHATPVAQSASSVDNVEHIYLPRLSAGHYRLDVVRSDPYREDWTYGLAWRIEKP